MPAPIRPAHPGGRPAPRHQGRPPVTHPGPLEHL